MTIKIISNKNHHLFVPKLNEKLNSVIQSNWFDIDYWQKKQAITGQSIGRNITWFIRSVNNSGSNQSDKEWVLRHYYRGGLIAKITLDRFFYTGIKSTRSYLELQLLTEMFQQDLPVPKPIAGRIIKEGLFYHADLLIEKIPHARDLVALLQTQTLSEKQWQAIGALIAQFHKKNIYHADLNAHNILMDDQNKLWLIDFDRCETKVHHQKWKDENLARLQRSFNKEKSKNDTFHFVEKNWSWLYQGYKNG